MSDFSYPRMGKILLDTPSAEPALGFDRTAEALAQLIRMSQPRFAIGVFGNWGSGKTTLMEAIKSYIKVDDTVVAVEFNAWRFEREPQLLVPLLDTVRAAIIEWSSMREPATGANVRRIASRIAKVIRALASGLSAEVGLPGAVKVSYDMGKTAELLGDGSEKPQSLYVASFEELSSAFNQLLMNGATRLVVFVDDLDRCLPVNALEVLESMKLFFDLPGFVFVVGLDKKVIQRAVRARYSDASSSRGLATPEPAEALELPSTTELERLELDYVDKIFQVPYHVPPMLADDLNALLNSMFQEAKLNADQLEDFNRRVRPYLDFIAVDRRVNPREVKRYLNAYTVQTSVRPNLDRDTVLALQTLTFRPNWQTMYDAILTDSLLFVDALKRYRAGEDAAFEDLHPELAVLPADLTDYLRSDRVDALCRQPSLDIYLSSLEATGRMPRELGSAYQALGRLRSALRKARTEPNFTQKIGQELASQAKEATELLDQMSLGSKGGAPGMQSLLRKIEEQLEALSSGLRDPNRPVGTEQIIKGTADTIYGLTNQLYRELRSLQRGDS
jgi:KAP family P-loop domain